MKKNFKRIFTSTIVLILIASFLQFVDIRVDAENYNDAAPYIQPTNSNGEKILFDNTHAQTAGAADWVIDGGFSNYANGLAAKGYYVKELRKNSPITYSDLLGYDVFVIPEANIPFKSSEQAAIVQYVQNGGSVFFISDHYNADRNKNRWDASEVFNGYRRGAYLSPTLGMSSLEAASDEMSGVVSSDWLANNFGVRFRYNAVGDVDATNIVAASDCFGITTNVTTVAMHAGSTIAIIDPTIAKGIVYLPSLTTSNKWSSAVDQGVYNSGGKAEGAYVAIAKKGLGKAAFLGDSSAVEDATPKYKKEETGGTKTTYDGYGEDDDSVLLIQLTDWLAKQESYTSFSQTSVSLDNATTLYSFETPSLSTEPVAEPWATPSAGYKWYDNTTFAVGSYGYISDSGSSGGTQDTYSFVMPTQIVAGKELSMTVRFSNLTPNTTLSNFKIGAYTDGGTQIGLFQNSNGTWPSTYGYSSAFSVTTDSNGNATKTLIWKLKDGTTGTFNLRLKQGTTNILTEQMNIY